MALLLRDREAAAEAATPPPGGGASGVVPDFACESCGAGMVRGQDWCLECGTAARGRLGAPPGWRAAFTVVGVTLLLVFGAGIAGYAALTGDAERTASAPTRGNGNPIVAPAPASAAPDVAAVPGVPGPTATTITPGETGPGTAPPAVTQVLPPGTAGAPVQTPPLSPSAKLPVIPPTKPVTPPGNQVVTPPAASTPAVPPKGAITPPATKVPATPVAAVQVIKLKPGAATSYDPGKRVGAEIGPAANAIDGKPSTVWDVTVPADGNPIGVGVLLELGAPYALQSLRIATDTPGFRVELYGAVGTDVPADVLDKRWQHLTDRKSVADGEPISLKGKGEAPKFQQFLVYVTGAAQPSDPRAAIGELTLRGTP